MLVVRGRRSVVHVIGVHQRLSVVQTSRGGRGRLACLSGWIAFWLFRDAQHGLDANPRLSSLESLLVV